MRLVIEREGGFDIIEDSDKVKAIDVGGSIVSVRIGAMTVAESFRQFPRASAEEAKALARAIAVKCGTLVEPLVEGPEVVTEAVMFDGGEVIEAPRNPNWSGGKASARSVREHFNAVEEWAGAASVPPKPASVWVDGEPPRDGRWYVVSLSAHSPPVTACWSALLGRWEDADGETDGLVPVAHLPTPTPNR